MLINAPNIEQKPCYPLCCFGCKRRAQKYKNNMVETSKYNLVTFLPKNLLLQFSKMANFYFLMIFLLELIPQIADTGGAQSVAMSLGFIVGLSMIKDAYEDLKRKLADRAENNSKALVSFTRRRTGEKEFRQTKWENIRVG